MDFDGRNKGSAKQTMDLHVKTKIALLGLAVVLASVIGAPGAEAGEGKKPNNTGLDVWRREFTNLRVPNVYNVRSDPFERGPESFEYGKWMADRAFLMVPAQAMVSKWMESFKEFPIRQKPASFNLDDVMTKLQTAPAEQPLEPTGSPTGKPPKD